MTASIAANESNIHFSRSESEEKHLPHSQAKSKWYVNPVADYLFACGGIVWIFFALHFFLLKGSTQGDMASALFTISAMGALIFGEGHTASTLVHLYRRTELHQRFALLMKLCPISFLALAVSGLFLPGAVAFLAKIYLLMVPQHFMAQSYGLARVYCLKADYKLDDDERGALLAVTWSTIAFGIARQLCVPQWSGGTLLGLKIPFWGPLPFAEPLMFCLFAAQLASMTVFLSIIALKALRTRTFFPLPSLMIMATSLLAYSMPQFADGIYWLYVSSFLHGTQYLFVVYSCDAKKWLLPDNSESKWKILRRALPALKLTALILLLSFGIYKWMPNLLAQCGQAFAASAVVIFCVMNLHHFFLDALIWKLRRPEVRAAVIL